MVAGLSQGGFAMRKVFLSCLGLGGRKPDGTYQYDLAKYTLDGESAWETQFVQAAELKFLGASSFDRVVIVTTQKAADMHFTALDRELRNLGVSSVTLALVEEDMSSEGQWRWFEKILEHIEPEDHLTVDFTHGYRAIPIIFSTAIHFLQRARRVRLEGVYYGAFEMNRGLVPIVDMKNFHRINEWAEALSRLVEDADTRKLAEVAKATPDFQVGELNDLELIDAMEDLTNRIRAADMHNAGDAAERLLGAIGKRIPAGSPVGKVLLDYVMEKYTGLVPASPCSKRYDLPYFKGQLALIGLLLEHKLHMQAFTVMREAIGSIGLIENRKAKMNTRTGQDQRMKAEMFIKMLQFDEDQWVFVEKEQPIKEGLLPFYNKIKACGIESSIRGFLKDLVKYRNGFDHGWTNKPGMPGDIVAQGYEFFNELRQTIADLESCGILGSHSR